LLTFLYLFAFFLRILSPNKWKSNLYALIHILIISILQICQDNYLTFRNFHLL
jgi:hypothetical protein